jgi:hypothetical protein
MQPSINHRNFFLLGMAGIFLGTVIFVRFRLLAVPLERDVGEYTYIAQQLLQGVLPYTESQSMKFPGIFFVYAGILTIFGPSPVAIHLPLLFVNLTTAFLLFFLGKSLLNFSVGIVAGINFSVLSLSPSLQGVWANSEHSGHYVLLPAVGEVLLLRLARDRPARFFLSGLFLGCDLLIKQHAIVFCIFGTLYLVAREIFKSHSLKKH